MLTTAFHWGVGIAEVEDGRLRRVRPHPYDPAPSEMLGRVADFVYSPARVRQPAVRRGFLKGRGGRTADRARGKRGCDDFVTVSWQEALDIVAGEIDRVRADHGNQAIFAGSYGWASAGRFHHALSQVHRFMNTLGGYTYSVDDYSYAAAHVLGPHVIGPMPEVLRKSTVWPVIERHSELVVMFGGVPASNTQIAGGSLARHRVPGLMRACREAGVAFSLVSPNREDASAVDELEWIAPRPNTDVALMLGLAHTLLDEDLLDRAFLASHTVGFERFRRYLEGADDGVPKTAEWAASVCAIGADVIRDLARRMSRCRTMILTAASLQRADHGEQPIWMTIVLAAMLGQIGLAGGGFGLCYGSDGKVGAPVNDFRWPALPQGTNAVASFIPVARIADMLLNPGMPFRYNGGAYEYPDIRLVYWAGGNPFHHHQDLNRLTEAFRKPDTIIVNEIAWTATARHADIVLPVTTALERNDICMNRHDDRIVAMKQAIAPVGLSRNDFDIFADLAGRLGCREAFTAGRDEAAWLRELWGRARDQARERRIDLPTFDAFWEKAVVELPAPEENTVLFDAFRQDPEANPLKTPSGKIEIFSRNVAGFGLPDCPGFPVWLEPQEWLGGEAAGRYPFHLISGQPKDKLHSQMDAALMHDRAGHREGLSTAVMNPADAAARGLGDGDIVALFNARGSCLARVACSGAIRERVVELRVGGHFLRAGPATRAIDLGGNANVLTLDKGTSALAQGTIAHTALVDVRAASPEELAQLKG